MTAKEILQDLISTIEKNSTDNKATITNVDLWVKSWKEELKKVNNVVLDDVSEMFDFAGYLYGNFDYHDNTKYGDIYIHNDNNLKYTREKIYQQWLGTRNSR